MPELGGGDVDHNISDLSVRSCEGKLCSSSVQWIKKAVAVKICHHEVCQDYNNGLPLALCLKCDEVHHLGVNAKHARFEINKPRMKLTRSSSTQSNQSDHDSGAEEDMTDGPTKIEKKTRGYSTGKRIFKLTANTKRKPRRHNTEDPGRDFFTVRFHGDNNEDNGREIVPALKGKTLKDSLEPFFTERNICFLTHSVFLDASNTPLPLAFDTFPMGGNVLHVKANGVVKVDQRVIEMVNSVEDCKPPDEYVIKPRSKSVMDNTSLSRAKGNMKKLEQDERERQTDEFLKMSQRGKKNIMSFFGEDNSNPSFTGSNPVLQSAPQGNTMGALHRPKSTSKLSGLFTNNQQKPQKEVSSRGSTVRDVLSLYSVYGLNDMNQVDTTIKDEPHESELKLEESWMNVVDEQYINEMSKKEKDQQEAIWELLTTEVAYIQKLSIIKKLFILCLRNLKNEGFLQDIEVPKLFSNIEEIYELNLSFWLDCLSDVVKQSRRTGAPLDPNDMSESFPMFDKRFEPYITYCTEESYCLKYFKRNYAENEDFKTYITWCEEHRLCANRLKLSDYLVKPMQRLTKYPLLLKAIQKKTLSDDIKNNVGGMISTVESLLSKVNGAMRILYEKNKLLAISKRITNNYNVIEAMNDEMERLLTNYSSFDLMELMPGLDQHRSVINEGPLRLVEKQGKTDVHVFLFTDLLLLTKAKKGDKYRVLKPPLKVDKLYVHPSKDQGMFLLIYVNEYNTAVQAFALQGTTMDHANHWMEAIRKAQKLLMVAQLGQGGSHLSRVESDTCEALVSPTTHLPSVAKRRLSAVSIESLDSDDEMGLNEAFKATNLARFSSEQTLNPGNSCDDEIDGFNERNSSVKKENDLNQEAISDSSRSRGDTPIDSSSKKSSVHPDFNRLRSESSTKVSRSSSAPQKDRPKIDGTSLSRSCSEPAEPKRFFRKTSKGEIITEGLPLANDCRASLTSSSFSESEISSTPSLQNSIELSMSMSLDESPFDPRLSESFASNSSDQNDDATCNNISPASRPVTRSSSAPVPLKEIRPRSESDGQDAGQESGVEDDKAATYPRRGNRTRVSPGLKALQSLSETLEISLKQQPSKQAPQIKSPLIAQQKLQSAIGPGPEPTRKKTTLPKRSSPILSRRPDNLMRSKSYSGLNKVNANSPENVKDFLTLSTEFENRNNESTDDRVDSTTRSIVESRLPLKPDKEHYKGLEVTPQNNKKQFLDVSNKGSNTPRLRKKSMSLSDLLSIGRDLTGGRSKNNDSGNSSEGTRTKSEHTTDDRGEPIQRKHSRFRLGRSKSRSDKEMKDGIVSGPNIDKRKATRLFLTESLMLESSEYV